MYGIEETNVFTKEQIVFLKYTNIIISLRIVFLTYGNIQTR